MPAELKPVDLARLEEGPAPSALASVLRPRPRPGQSWMQVLSPHSTAFDLSYSFSEVFEEEQLQILIKEEPFSARLARNFPGVGSGPPRSQLQAVKLSQGGRILSKSQQEMAAEASRRHMLQTIAGSWRSTRSALNAWGCFCEAFSLTHFPITRDAARLFSVFVAYGPTLGKYLQHLRWAHIFLGLSNEWWTGDL